MLKVSVAGRSWEFDSEASVTIGRGSECPVLLTDPRVSRRHLELFFDRGWVARDLDTRNGTFLAGTKVAECRVGTNLTLLLGDSEDGLVIELVDNRAPENGIAVGTGITLGRGAGNDVVLSDLLASRKHASVIPNGTGGYEVTDLSSRNHTFVNGSAIGASVLREGDVLTIGKSRFELRLSSIHAIPDDIEHGISAKDMTYRLGDGQILTDQVSFALNGPSLLAIIGPSGAGKSTLLRLLSGELEPSSGASRYQGVDVHHNQAETRNRIGVVPQHTIAHRQLTARAALTYSAELRLSADTSPADRQRRVGEVLDELGLAAHGNTRVARLSGGQQRRLSIAFELLTQPSLLLLDEPTSGLDPGLVRHVMQLLRGLADTGRQVIVTTHDLAHLDLCDLVLILLPGGKIAYFGPPAGIQAQFGTSDWADIFDQLTQAPRSVNDRPTVKQESVRRFHVRGRLSWRHPEGPQAAANRDRIRQQTWVVARRQVAILAADRPYVGFLGGLPVILAVLALTVPGGAGLALSNDPASTEAMRLLVLLIVGAAFMGTAATVRDLVGERGIYQHERAGGLLPTAYVGAKLFVFGTVATVQSMILVALFLLVRNGPPTGSLLWSGNLELFLAVVATTIAGTVLGLAISAFVATAEQTMPPLVIAVMAQFVLCGGLIEITGRPVLEQLSWLSPARWGYAAAASTADVRGIVSTAPADALWSHHPWAWISAMVMLFVLITVAAGLARVAVARH